MMPPSVSRAVERYVALLAAEEVGFLRGVYLIGSMALGDYQDGRSDIDFAAVTDGPLESGKTARLARVHSAMAELGTPHFDGFYIEARHLPEAPEAGQAEAFVQDGLFQPNGPCFEVNPVTWHLWALHGVVLRGSAPDELGLALDDAALVRFEIANLQSYWLGWVRKTRSSLLAQAETDRVPADRLAWGVLGVARIACTLATGRVVSKTDAGHWALEDCGDEEAILIEAALAARRGEIADMPVSQAFAALDFMKKTIERSCSLAKKSGMGRR